MERLCEYFACSGLLEPPELAEESREAIESERAEEIVDVSIAFEDDLERETPPGYAVLSHSAEGRSGALDQSLVHTSRSAHRDAYLVYRRRGDDPLARSMPAVCDISIVYHGRKELCPDGYRLVRTTHTGRDANLVPAGSASTASFLAVRYQHKGARNSVASGTPATAATWRLPAERNWQWHLEPALLDLAVVCAGHGERAPAGYAICDRPAHRATYLGTKVVIAIRRGTPQGLCALHWKATLTDRYPEVKRERASV